ncbi:MAG: NAD(P)H-hydrate dehydratase [Candidatus Aminicenantes bacterium]
MNPPENYDKIKFRSLDDEGAGIAAEAQRGEMFDQGKHGEKGDKMKVLTAGQMKNIDRRAIEEIGIIGPILMENAGRGIAEAVEKRFPRIEEKSVLVVAGKGNNGGDGFVVARHLDNKGAFVRVILLAEKKDLDGDAGLNCGIADKMGIDIIEAATAEQWQAQQEIVAEADILIDAVFGTGLQKPAGGRYADVIDDINKAKAFKVAVDIPSGMAADRFQIIGPTVKADLTVTMAAPKIAHVFPPAEEYVGELIVADISTPPFLFEEESPCLTMVEENMLLPYFSKREKNTHKGTYGHLFILSGSLGKTGAAAMSGKAALKMGAGLVTVGTPKSCVPIVARSMEELMTEPLPETSEWTLSEEGLNKILFLLKGMDAVMIGPGLSVHESTSRLIKELLPRLDIPMVLDADALNIIADDIEILKELQAPAVLTPHPGEFARLIHSDTGDVVNNKIERVPDFARRFGVHVVLKGYRTLISDPDGHVFINPTGNPGMATGGSGDVLSGMLGAMIIQEEELQPAVTAGVYVHGMSGDIAAEKLGEKSLLAGDIISFLPEAVKRLGRR